jgi:periplasmic divalent cation tolerance protein
MVSGKQSRVALVTCGSANQARRIAKAVVGKRLAACVNILPGTVHSIYRWKGKVASGREVLMVIKTTARRLAKLEKEVKKLHSYDVPEFVVVPIVAAAREYMRWLLQSVKKQ